MKLVTYENNKKECIGFLNKDEKWIYPLKALGLTYPDMNAVVENLTDAEIELLEYTSRKDPDAIAGALKKNTVRLLAPIPCPRHDVICLGANEMAHAAEETSCQEKACGDRLYPVYCSKRVNRAVTDGDPIPAHQALADSLDYEPELAVIIRKDAWNVPPEKAQEYIFGYTILNDVSARSIQTRRRQWYFGKSLDGFAPMGPCITTADAIPFPPKLKILSCVNGELRQSGSTELLVFDIPHIIGELSRGMTLKAGTIIAVGAPSKTGTDMQLPRLLKPGDIVECYIEGIGSITNPVR